MMKTAKTVLAATALSIAGATAAIADPGDPYNGRHEVISYKSQRFIAVALPNSSGLSVRFYRARGALWQEWGSTSIGRSQQTSNGSIRQNIWFRGRKVGYTEANLRSEFDLFRPENIAR